MTTGEGTEQPRGDWRDWRWDPTLFEGAAPYYERGRLPYPERLAEAFQRALELDGSGRLLDVGCGPGSIALRIASLFDQVVGLDADEGMLHEAARLASERGVTNATWMHRRAEDIDANLGRFRVVTFAQSFHWMDRPLVAAKVRTLLDPEGALVHVDTSSQGGLPDPLATLRREYLGKDRRAGQSIRNTSPGDEDTILRESGFRGPEITEVPDGRVLRRSIDDLIAQSLSTSGGAPHLFGDRLDDFVRDARTQLERDLEGGYLEVTLPENRLKVWRPA